MTFKLDIDYKRKMKEGQTGPTYPEMTSEYIIWAVGAKNPNGIPNKTERRMFAKIQRKMDDAIDEKLNEVEFNDTEIDFIKKAFVGDVGFPAPLSKYVVILEDYIESLGAETKKAEEETKTD